MINFKEAKQLTIKAFSEIQATSQNFISDFIENLKSKVQELITKRQNSEKRPYTHENGTRQGKTR